MMPGRPTRDQILRRVRAADLPRPSDRGERAITGMGGHSGYWLDPDWERALATVRGSR